jgi:hypothetical protein
MKKVPIVLCSLFICLPSLNAADFGLLVNQYAGANNQSAETSFEYQASILPRLSLPLGDSGNFFVSAGVTLDLDEGDFTVIPELLRTELSFRSGNWGIRAGRMQYADPLGFIASGLFDGIRFSLNSRAGIFSVGAWYTGLLYKKNAVITMTAAEQVSYDTPVDYDDFLNTYFAPRRLLASLDWEHPSFAGLLYLKAALSAQMDFTDGEEKFHSQYVTLKVSVPVKSFGFELGGSLETTEPAVEDKKFNIAFAWDLGVFWTLPTSFNSQLSLTGRFASGNTGGITGAFVPLTGKLYGNILRAKLSGISMLNLDYTARLAESFGMSLTASHFVRNDQGTYTAYPVNIADNTGHFLGTELFALFAWSPFSDLRLNFGGGAFLPVLGNVNRNERIQWRAELTAILALY